jgi:hypothetical protein
MSSGDKLKIRIYWHLHFATTLQRSTTFLNVANKMVRKEMVE